MGKLQALSTPVNLITGVTESVNFSVITDAGAYESRSIPSDHPNFAAVAKLLEKFKLQVIEADDLPDLLVDAADLEKAVRIKFETVAGMLDGRMTVSDGAVRVDGDPIDPALEAHVLRLLGDNGKPREDANWLAFAAFVENLYGNASAFVRKQLFGWLSYENLHGEGFTLTEDGCFIGYKGCEGSPEDARSIRTGQAFVDGVVKNGKIPNKIGSTITMVRSAVEADPTVGCAPGLHVGTHNYAKDWANGVVLTVKVNPRDVVSVPTHCEAQKIRTCRYTVVEAVEGPVRATTYYSASSVEDETPEASVEFLQMALDGDHVVTFTYHGKARSVLPEALDQVTTGWRFSGLDQDEQYRTFKVSKMSDLDLAEAPAVDADASATPAPETEPDSVEFIPAGTTVEFDYNGKHRVVVVDDYTPADNGLLLHGTEDGQHKSFHIGKVENLVTPELVTPAEAAPAEADGRKPVLVEVLTDAQLAGKAVAFLYKDKPRKVTVEAVTKNAKDRWAILGRSVDDRDKIRTFVVAKITELEVITD